MGVVDISSDDWVWNKIPSDCSKHGSIILESEQTKIVGDIVRSSSTAFLQMRNSKSDIQILQLILKDMLRKFPVKFHDIIISDRTAHQNFSHTTNLKNKS